MSEYLRQLEEERKRIIDRLALINVDSTGRDRLLHRLREVNAEIAQAAS